jgi:hypothetical protein
MTWSFAMWGLVLLGPFKKTPGGLTHLLVVIDKFTKWIEARPLAKINSKQMVSFIQDIIFHFGVPSPSSPTMAPSSQGRSSWISVMTTTSRWTGSQSPTHAQTEREHANGLILQGLKPCILAQEGEDIHTRLLTKARKWANKVPRYFGACKRPPTG